MIKNIMNRKAYSFSVLMLVFLCLFAIISCKTEKKIIAEPVNPVKEKGADFLFEQLKKSELKFNFLTVKIEAETKTEKETNSFNVNLRIKKDSIIWMTISAVFGIEVARVLITNDSVKLIDKFHSTFFKGDFKYINNMFSTELDFDILQAILVGNDFSFYENDVFKARSDGKDYLLSTVGRRKLKKHLKENETAKILIQDIWLNSETFKIVRVMMKDIKEKQKLEVEYFDFNKLNEQLFPGEVKINVKAEKSILEADLKYSSPELRDSMEFPFNISKKYTQVFLKENKN
ncbi:MAG: DUF4292 domain-containing protein [Bacteroidetes bacterium]|nr:DUF4292 domain-containing protein [Bacteroidota bacterium]